MKKGFTLIELMAVVAIIGVLLGFVMTAASGAIKQSRGRKAEATRAVVEQGLATYRERKGRWPGSVGDRISSGSFSGRSNNEGLDNQSDTDKYVLDTTEADDMIREMVLEGKNGNPMLDVSGLFVSSSMGTANGRNYGMDFRDAVHGTSDHPKKMKVAEMHFGYPESSHGYFRPFKIVYSIPTDQMKVNLQ